ncbi:acyltransferase [Flavihumibacter sp. R14]|nr:acyltransferase [Flavihumibacter soli]
MTRNKNAFDLLRLLLAISVIISHSILIGGYKIQDPLTILSKNQTSFADFGVMGFFALSGYLITASFERTRNVFNFATNRLLRILPGFWVCLFVTAFILAPLIFLANEKNWNDFPFTGDGSSTNYLLNNFFLPIRQWSINEVLNEASYRESLNGSLWSLYPEIQCYSFTVIAGLLGLFNKNRTLYLLFSITIFIFFSINSILPKSYGPTILILSPALKLYSSYIAGSLTYVFRDQMILDKKGTISLTLFTLVLLKFGGYNLLSPVLIALTLLNVFQLFTFNIKYDVSYGVYIYSFPVQQLLFQIFGGKLDVLYFIALSLLISVFLGFLSYVLIEKPFIDLRTKTKLTFPSPLFKKKEGIKSTS